MTLKDREKKVDELRSWGPNKSKSGKVPVLIECTFQWNVDTSQQAKECVHAVCEATRGVSTSRPPGLQWSKLRGEGRLNEGAGGTDPWSGPWGYLAEPVCCPKGQGEPRGLMGHLPSRRVQSKREVGRRSVRGLRSWSEASSFLEYLVTLQAVG